MSKFSLYPKKMFKDLSNYVRLLEETNTTIDSDNSPVIRKKLLEILEMKKIAEMHVGSGYDDGFKNELNFNRFGVFDAADNEDELLSLVCIVGEGSIIPNAATKGSFSSSLGINLRCFSLVIRDLDGLKQFSEDMIDAGRLKIDFLIGLDFWDVDFIRNVEAFFDKRWFKSPLFLKDEQGLKSLVERYECNEKKHGVSPFSNLFLEDVKRVVDFVLENKQHQSESKLSEERFRLAQFFNKKSESWQDLAVFCKEESLPHPLMLCSMLLSSSCFLERKASHEYYKNVYLPGVSECVKEMLSVMSSEELSEAWFNGDLGSQMFADAISDIGTFEGLKAIVPTMKEKFGLTLPSSFFDFRHKSSHFTTLIGGGGGSMPLNNVHSAIDFISANSEMITSDDGAFLRNFLEILSKGNPQRVSFLESSLRKEMDEHIVRKSLIGKANLTLIPKRF